MPFVAFCFCLVFLLIARNLACVFTPFPQCGTRDGGAFPSFLSVPLVGAAAGPLWFPCAVLCFSLLIQLMGQSMHRSSATCGIHLRHLFVWNEGAEAQQVFEVQAPE